MNNEIKEVLTKIEEKGFEAYVVGGYVRDYLRKVKSFDVDICTSALPKDIKSIFETGISDNYGSIKLKTTKFTFDITTYRLEQNYVNRRPIQINYCTDLVSDLKRRDFTINAICMNKKGQIIDFLGGVKDLKNRRIKVIGNLETKLTEDPLRMLRAIRFAAILNWTIEANILAFIKENKDLLKTLSIFRIKQEIGRILISKNALVGLNLIKILGLEEPLAISFKEVVLIDDILGMWAQINTNWPLASWTKNERKIIKNIKTIVAKGEINAKVLFDYGLYETSVSSKILGLNYKKIAKEYSHLPIKSLKDIKITRAEIMDLLKIDNKNIAVILEDIKEAILDGKIKNERGQIINFVSSNTRKWLSE